MNTKPHSKVIETASLERLAGGFEFAEGPVWNVWEKYLIFSDVVGDTRYRWSEESGLQVDKRSTNKGNGLAYDPEGNLIICEHATSSLVRERPDGATETIASHYQTKALNSPNDVVVAQDGALYFTDPVYGRWPGFGVERAQELDIQGVYRVPAGGGEIQLVVDDFDQPNGLCFSPDGSLLYINDTPRAHIRVFDVLADGALANGRIFFENIGRGVIEEGVADGMKCDQNGAVYVTGPKGVWVISAEGVLLGVIQVPENVGNLAWGGDDWKMLYLASSSSLYRLPTEVAGSRPRYMR